MAALGAFEIRSDKGKDDTARVARKWEWVRNGDWKIPSKRTEKLISLTVEKGREGLTIKLNDRRKSCASNGRKWG